MMLEAHSGMMANDAPMDAGDQVDTQPLPDGLACAGCGYDLAGLPRGGVCPECGLKTLASNPVWTLAECDGGYIDHVRDEFAMLGWAAQACWVLLASTFVAAIASMFDRGAGVLGIGAAITAACAAVVLPLVVFYALRAIDKHPNTQRAPGAWRRRRLGAAMITAEVGLLFLLFWFAIAFLIGGDLGAMFLLAFAALAGSGLGLASIEAMAYGRLTLERAGLEGVGSGLLPGWGFALAVLAVVALGWMIVGIDPPTALAAMAGAMLGPTTSLAMRCARVASVLGQMVEKTAG